RSGRKPESLRGRGDDGRPAGRHRLVRQGHRNRRLGDVSTTSDGRGSRMTDYAIFWEWLSFAVRWTHVITAIAWIGSSFYFIALDLGLRKPPGLPPLAHGEEWQVHGGGFYHIQKYLVAPAFLPEHLTWFKWESYATWLSGAALLAVVYYFG